MKKLSIILSCAFVAFVACTKSNEVQPPQGAIDGLFTINDNGNQVYFSKGNLQYQASTNIWRFAENQWDFVGDSVWGTIYEHGEKCDNSQISSDYGGWIDLFGWGTSGWNNGNTYYHPWNYEMDDSQDHGFGYGPTDKSNYTFDLADNYVYSDWGVYNAILNGGNRRHQWRTLTSDEWVYVFNTRSTLSGIRYLKANVNSINGLILLPDNWNDSTFCLCDVNNEEALFSSNVLGMADWNVLEKAGAVFFPAAGGRYKNIVSEEGTFCGYWSSTHLHKDGANCMGFAVGYVFPNGNTTRNYGKAVRLVQDTR